MFSKRRARARRHPSLWPYYALWRLTLWAGLIGAGYGAVAGLVFWAVALWAMYVVFFFGLIPATFVAVIDGLVRNFRRPTRAARRLTARQDLVRWSVMGGLYGLAAASGYAVVYVNAFQLDGDLFATIPHAARWGAAAGLASGWLAALEIDLVQYILPAERIQHVLARGALLWGGNVLGLGALGYWFVDSTYQTTLLPAALTATLGAGIVPLLAARKPQTRADLPSSKNPAPSPGPETPEGGPGEGATGDWRTAPPPQIPRDIAGGSATQPTGSDPSPNQEMEVFSG